MFKESLAGKYRRQITDRHSALKPESDFRDTVLVLIKAYYQVHEDNHLLMDLFKLYKIDKRTIVELLLDTKEEERIIKIIKDNIELLEYLQTEDLFEGHLYQLFVLYDPMTLIIKFNTPISKKKNPSVFTM